MSLPTYPSQSFGRQDVAALVDLPDDVLGYWLTNNLLVPLQSPDSKARSHRRFDFRQINVAALLKAVHPFGVSISGLRAFSSILQDSIRISSISDDRDELYSVSSAIQSLSKLRSGQRVQVLRPDGQFVDAACSNDILQDVCSLNDCDFDRLKHLVKGRKIQDATLIRVYLDLTSSEHLVDRGGTGRGANWDEQAWVISPADQGGWQIVDPESSLGSQSLVAGIYIVISKIIRSVWSRAQIDV